MSRAVSKMFKENPANSAKSDVAPRAWKTSTRAARKHQLACLSPSNASPTCLEGDDGIAAEALRKSEMPY